MKRRNLIWLVLLGAALSTVAAFPWLIYWIGLGMIDGRPEYATRAATAEEVDSLRKRLRISQPVQIDALSPYSYLLLGADKGKSTAVAWVIARAHNVEHLSDRRYWHLSGAALIIWLTRNWTPTELVAKAVELERDRPSPSKPSGGG
jgi:hypothetical protein